MAQPLRCGKRPKPRCKAELLWCSENVMLCVWFGSSPEHKARLYWDSCASAESRIPQWWERHCKASQVQPRLHRSLLGCLGSNCSWMVAGISLRAGPWCLQQGTGRWTLWHCLNLKGIKRLRCGLTELRLLKPHDTSQKSRN